VHDRRAVMASDASDFAVASYSIEGIPEFSFSAELQDEEKKESSSVRELLAILRTLDHINVSSQLQTSEWTTLWWLTDNANVEKMIAKGSGKLRITRVVLEILRKGRALKYDVHPIWVSRDNPFLQKADCLSKGIDSDNWSVGAEDFSNLDVRFGPFTSISSPPVKTRRQSVFIHVPLIEGIREQTPSLRSGTGNVPTWHPRSHL
jgi:hypothetical protein